MSVLILHAKHSSIFDVYWRIKSNQRAHLELYYRNPGTFERTMHIAEPDRVIQLNYGEVCTHGSCEAAIKW